MNEPKLIWSDPEVDHDQCIVITDGGRSNYYRKKNVGDCVVRAIVNATGRDYKEVYDEMFHYSRVSKIRKRKSNRSPRNGVNRKIIRKYMADQGHTWVPCMKIGQGCKIHLRGDELPSGRLVAKVYRSRVELVRSV